MSARQRRYLACAVVAGSIAVLAAAAQAAGGADGKYHGRTSQGRPISFRVSGGHLRDLQFAINVVCPSHRVWKVSAAVSAPVRIVNSRFDQSFSSRRPRASGTARLKGTVHGASVTGTLAMKRYIGQERHYCSGSASFNLRDTPVGTRAFAHESRRYYDAGSERTASGPMENTSKLVRSRIPDTQR